MKKKITKVRVDNLPEKLKEELGIPEEVTNFREMVKNDPAIQEKIKEYENLPDVPDSTDHPQTPDWVGRTTLPKAILKKRNEYVVGLFMLGLSWTSILKNVNHNCASKGRYPVKMDTVRRIVRKHYEKPELSVIEQRKENDALMEAQFERMQWVIEKAMKFANNKKDKDWKAFEFITTWEKIFQMSQTMVENRNWNASRANPMISIQNNELHVQWDMHVNTFQRGSTMMHLKKSAGYTKLLDKLNKKISWEEDEWEILEGTVSDG